MPVTRRDLLISWAAWVQVAEAAQHAHEAQQADPPGRMTVLDAGTARELDAITAQILPSDDGPGAREAGVIWFIDRALATFDADQRGAYTDGMAEVRRLRLKMFPASESVAALGPGEQRALIRAMQSTDFFGLLRKHTVMGFLGHPKYGGNRGQVGWKHIGFESRMAFTPPFGYYDAPGRERE